VNIEAGEIRFTADDATAREPRLSPFAASRSLAAIQKARYAARLDSSVCVFERPPGKDIDVEATENPTNGTGTRRRCGS
jgi:hypothetical protein